MLSMEDNHIKCRIDKYWSVIKTVVKGGIRFCHPSTMRQLYSSLAVSTLSYGIELRNLTDGLLNKLNIEGRKSLKTLFNFSVQSRNYLNTLLNIEHISSIIITNKLNLLTCLLNNKNKRAILFFKC